MNHCVARRRWLSNRAITSKSRLEPLDELPRRRCFEALEEALADIGADKEPASKLRNGRLIYGETDRQNAIFTNQIAFRKPSEQTLIAVTVDRVE